MYEAPSISRIGSIQEITQGGDPDALGDGSSFRGPADDPDPTPTS